MEIHLKAAALHGPMVDEWDLLANPECGRVLAEVGGSRSAGEWLNYSELMPERRFLANPH